MSKQHENVASDLAKKQLSELGFSQPEPVVEVVEPWGRTDLFDDGGDYPFYPKFRKPAVRSFAPSVSERDVMKGGVPPHHASKFEFDKPEKWKATVEPHMLDEIIYSTFHKMVEDLKRCGLHPRSILSQMKMKECLRDAVVEHFELRHDKVYTVVLKKGAR